MTLAEQVKYDITYRVESKDWLMGFFSDIPTTPDRLQVEALIKKHQDEIVVHKHLQRLDPDWKRYRELVQQNRIFVIFARDEYEIVGYIVVFVLRHLHDRTLVYSMDDLYYIEQTQRGAGIGAGMIAAAERHAKKLGSRLMTLRAKKDSRAARFLQLIGYHEFETVYAKEL